MFEKQKKMEASAQREKHLGHFNCAEIMKSGCNVES